MYLWTHHKKLRRRGTRKKAFPCKCREKPTTFMFVLVISKYLTQRDRVSYSASRDTPRLFWNTKIHYCVHTNPPLAPILNQINAVHNFPAFSSKIHFNITILCASTYSKWSFPVRFSDQNFVCISQLSCMLHAPSISSLICSPW